MRRIAVVLTVSLSLMLAPLNARADMFGGDIAVLLQILAQALQTVVQLKSILATGQDTLELLHDVNSGLKSGLELIRILNPRFNPGVYGDLRDPESALRAIQDIYGAIPQGADRDLIQSQDQSVAEAVAMNRNLYDYADNVDRERERILFHAGQVSPQGAAKLENQSLAVLIGVSTQMLRTQSQILKLLGQNMAFQNRKEKFTSQNFQDNYRGLSNQFQVLPKDVKLPKLGGGQ